jgi:hypothetical protein
MRRWLKSAAAICTLLLAVTASVAIANQGTDGGSERSRDGVPFRPGPHGARHLSALAEELGVSTEQLRDAFRAVRDELRPPRRPSLWQRPSREQLERRCVELTNALASELGKSGADVRSAIKTVAKEKVEAAREAGRLTEEQAERITARIDAAECLPPGPPGGHVCRGPGGPRHFGPPRAPDEGDGEGGSQRRGSFEEAVPIAPPAGV